MRTKVLDRTRLSRIAGLVITSYSIHYTKLYELRARGGELQGPRLAPKQGLAAIAFQQPYLVADGRGCDGKLLCRLPEAQKAGRGFEGLKLSEWSYNFV